MTKGFKVIPKETPKKEEWDYERIKQRVKGKQIVFQENKVVLVLSVTMTLIHLRYRTTEVYRQPLNNMV